MVPQTPSIRKRSRATVQVSAECHGHIAIGAYSPSPRSCHYCASCRPRGRPNASSPTCTGPSRSVVSSLIGIFPPMGSLNSSSKNAAMQRLRLDCCQWAGRRPLVLSRRLKLAAAGPGPLSGLATSTRRQRAGSQGDKAPARVGARCCHCPPPHAGGRALGPEAAAARAGAHKAGPGLGRLGVHGLIWVVCR